MSIICFPDVHITYSAKWSIRERLPGLEADVGSVTCRRRSRSVTMAALTGLFPHPDSTILYVMEFLLAASGPLDTYNEATLKKNMNYAKFAHGREWEEGYDSEKDRDVSFLLSRGCDCQ